MWPREEGNMATIQCAILWADKIICASCMGASQHCCGIPLSSVKKKKNPLNIGAEPQFPLAIFLLSILRSLNGKLNEWSS